MIEEVHISKALMSIYHTTGCYILEESNVCIPSNSNLTSHKAVHSKVPNVSTIFSDVQWWNFFHMPCYHEHVRISDKYSRAAIRSISDS